MTSLTKESTEMEHLLTELLQAAIEGDTSSLNNIMGKDPLLLHKGAARNFKGAGSPLHAATSNGQKDFVDSLLTLKPELTEVLDSQKRSALHLASARGLDEIVNELVKVNPDMCQVRDREGKNPLHVAAMKGEIDIVKELVRACPEAARDRVGRNETVLHLCVKHKRLECLEILLGTREILDLVNAKDSDGNTILHLAILCARFQIAKHILENKIVDVNAKNASGHTAMDLFLESTKKVEEPEGFDKILLRANAERAKDLIAGDWLTKKRECLMVVASLIATMAFQATANPPGGVWQDDSTATGKDAHRAGEAVMAYNYKDSYPYFLRFNTIGFVASLTTILLLISGLKFRKKAAVWTLMMIMWLAITATAFTFAYANVVVTPIKDRRPLSNTIKIGVIVWAGVMSLLLLNHTITLARIFKKEKRAIKRIMGFWPQRICSFVDNHARVKDGGQVPRRDTEMC